MTYSENICKFCLTNRYILKDLWGINLIQGHREVYGEMITDCFAISWRKPVDRTELICESCIKTLLIAFKFKRDVLASEKNLLEHLKDEDNECDEIVEEDMIDDNIIQEDLIPDEDFENKTISDNLEHSEETVVENIKEELEYFEAVYSEDSIHVEPVKEEEDLINLPQQQETTNEVENSTVIDLENCLKAITSNKLVPIVVLERYLPKKTEQLKQGETKPTDVSQNQEVCSSQLTKTHEDKEEPKEITSEFNSNMLFENKSIKIVDCKLQRLPSQSEHISRRIITGIAKKRDCTRQTQQYSAEDLQLCLSAVKSGRLTATAASVLYDIPISILHRILARDEDKPNVTANSPVLKHALLPMPSPCALCGQNMPSSSSLAQHQCTRAASTSSRDVEERGERTANKFTCDICKGDFKWKRTLYKHMVHIHKFASKSKIPFTCKICNKKFSYSSNLIRHQRNKICNLIRNQLVHTGEKPYSCKICNKHFARSANLIRYQLVHTGEKPFSCKICNKQFSISSNLITHQRIHTGEKPYLCKICNKQFLQRSHLIRHQGVHTGAKSHSCKICHKQFSGSSTLIYHQRIHTGEKPYPFKICNKQFSQNSHLFSHQRVHTGEKPYSCKICSKQFSSKSNLNTHKRIHTGEKPYSCKICSKKFLRNEQLLKHEHSHSGDRR